MKEKHKGYRISIGVISIVLGSLLLLAYEGELGLSTYGVPGILCLASGIIQLNAANNKKLYSVSAILLFVGVGVNVLSIMDISIFSIYAIIIGIFNLIFVNEKD